MMIPKHPPVCPTPQPALSIHLSWVCATTTLAFSVSGRCVPSQSWAMAAQASAWLAFPSSLSGWPVATPLPSLRTSPSRRQVQPWSSTLKPAGSWTSPQGQGGPTQEAESKLDPLAMVAAGRTRGSWCGVPHRPPSISCLVIPYWPASPCPAILPAPWGGVRCKIR